MTLHKVIMIVSRPIHLKCSLPSYPKLIIDFPKNYTDTKKNLDPGFPFPFGPILECVILVDSDHDHDLLNNRYLTGLLSFASSSLVTWASQGQGSISSSTDNAESSAFLTATEEAQRFQCMLSCFG